MPMLRAWLELARISNLPTVWTNVSAGWLLAGGGWDARLGWLLLAGSLLYTGGMILNDAADVKFDREHRPQRAIPSGRVSAAAAWAVGAGMLAAGAGMAVAQGGACPWIAAGLVASVILYDLFHKPWSGAVWVMGSCRLLLVLLAASANDTGCKMSGEMLATPHGIALGVYIVGLTKVARLESSKEGAVVLSLVMAKLLLWVPAILAVAFTFWVAVDAEPSDWLPLLMLPVFAIWVFLSMRIMRKGGPHVGRAVGWLLAGIPIVDALAVGHVSLTLACGFAALAPLLRLWQRWIAAT